MQFQGMGKKAVPISLPPVEHHDLTPSPDVPLAIMKRKLMATNDMYEAKKIAAEMKAHLEVYKTKTQTQQTTVKPRYMPGQISVHNKKSHSWIYSQRHLK